MKFPHLKRLVVITKTFLSEHKIINECLYQLYFIIFWGVFFELICFGLNFGFSIKRIIALGNIFYIIYFILPKVIKEIRTR